MLRELSRLVQKRTKSAMALLLVVVLVLGSIPVGAMANTANTAEQSYTDTVNYDNQETTNDDTAEESNTEDNSSYGDDDGYSDNDYGYNDDYKDDDYGYNDEDDYEYEDDYDEDEEEEYELPVLPIEGLVPFNGGFSATIRSVTADNLYTTFGPGSRIDIPNTSATNTPQTVRVQENFGVNAPAPAVVVTLGHGLERFGTVPGFTGNNFTGAGMDDQPHLQGVLTGGVWVQDNLIVQNLTGNTFQPNSGVLVFLFAPGTESTNITFPVRAQRAFSQTGGGGRTHTNAITVQTFDDIGAVQAQLQAMNFDTINTHINAQTVNSEATLEQYHLVGASHSRLAPVSPTPNSVVRTYAPGDSWETHVVFNTYNQPETLNALFESATIVIHIDRNLGIQGVRSISNGLSDDKAVPIHAGFDHAMLQYTITDHPTNSSLQILTISLLQPNSTHGGTRFYMYGTIPMDATPGVYDPINLQQNQSPITPLPGGTESTVARGNAFGNIRIAAPFINRLDLRPIWQEFRHSSIPTAAGLDFLSGFLFRNEFADELYEQAIRIFFDDPAIGVQAMRLPVGTLGLGDLRAYTNFGNVITLPHAGVAVTAPTTFTVNRPNQIVDINFLGALAPGEFITEIYYELAGYVQEGFSNVANQLDNRTATDFFFLGQWLDHSVNSFSARAIAGQRCATSPDGIVQNPPEIADNSPYSLRSIVTDVRPIENRGLAYERFQVWTNSTGLAAPFVGGADWSRRSFGFSSSSTEWRSTNTHVTALKGHYVYLRAPLNIFEINQDTITVRWGTDTWTDGDGITVTPIVDSTGSQAFRIAIPYAISGHSRDDFAMAGTGLRNYPAINVDFDIRAVPWVSTQNIPANQIIMMVPMYDGVRPHSIDVNRQAFNPNFTIDCGTRPPRVRETGTNREVFGSTSVVNIVESANLITTVTTRSISSGGTVLEEATLHNWAGAGILSMVPGSTVQQEFRYFNPTNDNIGQFHAFIPIPREGYMLPLNEIAEIPLRQEVQREPFQFTLELTGAIATIPGFRIYYSTEYNFIPGHSSFELAADVTDWSAIRMVFIQSYRNIAPQEEGYFLLNLAHPAGADTRTIAGLQNAYAPLTFSSVLGNAAQRRSMPTAMRLWNYVIFNYNYTGSDGVFLEVPVAHGGTVTAPNPAPQRTGYTFDRWTTDAAGTTDYVFTTAVTAPSLNLFAQWTRNAYSITYAFTGTVPTGVTAPAARNNITAGTTGLAASAVTSPVTGTHNDLPGTFTFGGWSAAGIANPAAFTMPDGGVAFTGNWTFAANEFEVSYNKTGYVPAGAPSTPISRNVAAGTPDVSGTSITPTWVDGYEYGIAGIWTFSGWTAPAPLGATFTMPAANVVFSGTWEFSAGTPNVIYTVTGARPPSYSGMPPSPQVETSGTTVTVEAIPTTSETVNSAGTPGAWTFNGWNHATITGATFTVPNDNVEFTGYWTFTPDSFNVTYTVTGAAPANVSNMPTSPQSHAAGSTVTVASVPTTTATTNAAGTAGTWTFNGWSHPTITGSTFAMPNNNVEFTGSWTFTTSTGNGTDPTPNPAVEITKSAPPTVQPNTPLTYTITVRNIGDVTLMDLVVTDNLSEQLQDPRNLQHPTNVTAAFTGQTLNATISSLLPGQSVTISFVVTVDAAVGATITNTATVTVPSMPNVNDNSTVTTEVIGEQPELIKNPDRTVVRVGETINWTLSGFHNYTGGEVTNFTIVDMPGRGLNFQSGSLPAFANGEGITYEIRYRIYGSNEWRIHATGIDASRPFNFSLPQPGNLYYTDIGFFFGNVPTNFAINNQIVLTFVVGADAPNGELVNRFFLLYSNVEREGGSPETPIIEPDDSITGSGNGNGGGSVTDVTPLPIPPTAPLWDTEQPIADREYQTIYEQAETATDTTSPIIGRINPQTGDNFSFMGIILSLAGVVTSLGVLLLVLKPKRNNAA